MSAFAKHFRNYSSAGLIGSVIGIVSFPLLTRSLSVEEYGWLGLITATMTVFISVGKLGISSAIIRFLSETRTKGPAALRDMASNVMGASLALSIISLALWLMYSSFVVPTLKGGDAAVPLFYYAAALLPIGILFNIATSVLKADQRSGLLSSLTVLEKFARLVLIVTMVVTVGATAARVLHIAVVVEICTLCVVIYWCRKYLMGARPTLSAPTLRPMLIFGIPLMAKELIGVLLETGDRYVIQAYLGGDSLGHYAAAVNVTMYLEWVLLLALDNAIVPQYVRIYEERGRDATKKFLDSAMKVYYAAALGVFAVFSAAVPTLVLILAGERYEPGLVVMPWLAAALVQSGALTIVGAGVFVEKRPRPLLVWTGISLVFNLTLNILTVPIWGLQAAGIVTFLAMNVQLCGVWFAFRHTLPVKLPYDIIAAGLVAALLALAAAHTVDTDNLLLDMILKGSVSLLVYTSVILLLSNYARSLAKTTIEQHVRFS